MRTFVRSLLTATARRLPAALALAVCAGRAAAADLTDLSLQELMNVEAAGPSSQFMVSAVAVESCTVSATNHQFGNYDPLRALPTDNTSTVTVMCTIDSTYEVGLNAGMGPGATVAARRMTADAHVLSYSLYRDPGHTQVWGNTSGSDTVPGVGTGSATEHPLYGRIPARQPVRAGAYTDIITVTVSY